MRKTGYRPSPAHKVGLGAVHGLVFAAGQLPEEAFVALPPALDQLYSDCVANSGAIAICHAMAVALGKPTGPWPELPSRTWLYALLRIRSGDTLKDDNGGFIHAMAEAVVDAGFPKESQWSYGPQHLEKWPGWEAWRDAEDQMMVKGARRIVSTGRQRIQDVAIAIASGGVVQWGTRVDDAFMNLTASDVWPGVKDDTPDGHAMVLHGYRTETTTAKKQFASRSSWTPAFADNGSAWVDENAIASAYAEDFWIWETLPNWSGTA